MFDYSNTSTIAPQPLAQLSEDLSDYQKLGDQALKRGNEDQGMKWYVKGLNAARQQNNPDQVNKYSQLILTLL